MIMIGISENAIIFLGVKILIDKSEIADYLTKAKKLIVQNKFSIALNSNRMTNLSLFDEYLIDEERIKIILLDLTEDDFCLEIDQKGVDMKIGLDIASMAYKHQVDQIVLISGDSDFVSAAKLARREGVDFILDPLGAPIKPDLFEHIDGLRTCDKAYTTHTKK